MTNLKTSTTEENELIPLSKSIGLSTKEILAKLDPIPVFTIADEEGAPLVTSGETEGKVAGVFISEQDANDFVKELKSENPKLAKKVSVVPVSLGEIYKLSQADEDQQDPLDFAYVPEADEVKTAKTIAKEDGEKYQGGVPLFVAKGGKDQGYLTFERDGKQVIPFFFDKQQLDKLVANFQEQNPELASNVDVDIEVESLEGVIETLETGKDKVLSQIVLVPSSESIEFLESNDLKTTDDSLNISQLLNKDNETSLSALSKSVINYTDDSVENLDNCFVEDAYHLGVDPLSGSLEPQAENRYLNEETVFYPCSDQQEGTITSYHFLNTETETNFYAPSITDKDNADNNLPNYELEGIAYSSFLVDGEA
jgi:hypothetical protein